MITATTKMETKIPIPNPALKIPSSNEHPVSENEANSTNMDSNNLFFMISSF